VAPVTIGDGAYLAAGSVITRNVEPDALSIARGQQRLTMMVFWGTRTRARRMVDTPGRATEIRARLRRKT
jgi:bifunctional UDP-N-acetylglucosamine pyrophosphorylase/glucosamine-1-phosphate N-acetyltransferase